MRLALPLLALLLYGQPNPAQSGQGADNSGSMDGGAEPATLITGHQPDLPPVDETRGMLEQILAQPEYLGKETQEGWLQRFWHWLDGLFEGTGMPPLFGGWAGAVVILLLLAVISYLLVRLLWEIRVRRVRVRAESASGPTDELSSEGLMRAAEEAAGRGDYRQAIRLRFKALVSRLTLPASALKTNRQIARRIGREFPGAAGPFGQLVACFEDAWYGSLPCGASDYREAGTLAARVEERVLALEEA
ncbi:DUF4129 domain-containing protein [bacterium]|nr:DUF4129 domain-containing protein [bacterium]